MMTMSRKLLIIASVPLHIQTLWLPYPRHFRRLGWRVDGAAKNITKNPDCQQAFDHVYDIPFVRNPLWTPWAIPFSFFKTLRCIRQIVREGAYDIVHVSTPMGAFMARLALRHRGVQPKVIYTAQGFHFYKGNPSKLNNVYWFMERMAARWTDYLILNNQEDYDAAVAFGTIPKERVFFFPGIGVDPELYQRSSIKDTTTLRQELGVAPGDHLFLQVGELIPRKRQKDAITAFSTLAHSNTKLALAGCGRDDKKLRQLANQLGVNERVLFLGFRRDVPQLISAANTLLLPSSQEGLPRCIMEAMCIGTPVIASDIRGNRDLLGENGILFPCGDIPALARAMSVAIQEPQKLRHMATSAQATTAQYHLHSLLQLHEQLYHDALRVTRVE